MNEWPELAARKAAVNVWLWVLMAGGAMAGVDPIVAVCGPACGRPLRAIPDVPTNLLELKQGTDASGKPGAVQSAPHCAFGRVSQIERQDPKGE